MSGALKVTGIAAQVVASLGVSKVINDIIVNNTTIVTQTDALRVSAGSIVLGSMVVDAASDHVQGRINAFANWMSKRKSEEAVIPTEA